jgi:hypothetical protein
MESFWRRLKYYGVGFGIGLLFVFIFFQNRGCSWLPENRVKNSILERVLVIPESEALLMTEGKLTKQDVINVLNDGDVNFEKSTKKGDLKGYLIEKEFDNKGKYSFYFTLPTESFISEVHIFKGAPTSKIKNTKVGYGRIIHFPKDDDLVFVDTSGFVSCQQEALGLINPLDIYKLIKKNGRIDFSKTDFTLRPKPQQYIVITDKQNRKIGFKSIWYKNKINITSFDIPFENDCK